MFQQSGNLHNLQIVLRKLKIHRMCANLQIGTHSADCVQTVEPQVLLQQPQIIIVYCHCQAPKKNNYVYTRYAKTGFTVLVKKSVVQLCCIIGVFNSEFCFSNYFYTYHIHSSGIWYVLVMDCILNIKGYLQNSVILTRDLWFNCTIYRLSNQYCAICRIHADWHTFSGSSVCTMQSADCANSQIAWNIYTNGHVMHTHTCDTHTHNMYIYIYILYIYVMMKSPFKASDSAINVLHAPWFDTCTV